MSCLSDTEPTMGHILWPTWPSFSWPVTRMTRMTRDPWPSPRQLHESITPTPAQESWWVHDYCLLFSAMMCKSGILDMAYSVIFSY